MDVNVNVADNNKELIEALNKKSDESDDTELKDLMKQFIQVMAADAINKKATTVESAPAAKEDPIEDLSEAFEG